MRNSVLREELQKEIDEVIEQITKRTRNYAESFIVNDLVNLNRQDKYPITKFNQEDLDNHNYDLGRLKTLEEVLSWI